MILDNVPSRSFHCVGSRRNGGEDREITVADDVFGDAIVAPDEGVVADNVGFDLEKLLRVP